VTKVKQILVVGVVVEAKLDTERSKRRPFAHGIEKEWLVMIEAEISFVCGFVLHRSNVAVLAGIARTGKVHGSGTGGGVGATGRTEGNTGFQFRFVVVSAVGTVREPHGMIVIGPVLLIEGVRFPNLNANGGHDFVPAFLKRKISPAVYM